MLSSRFRISLFILIMLLAACGTIVTPEAADDAAQVEEAHEEDAAESEEAETDEDVSAQAVSDAQADENAEDETVIEATLDDVPASSTPTVEPTSEPTEVPASEDTASGNTTDTDEIVDETDANADDAEFALEVEGDAANGAILFTSNGCSACHNTSSDDPLVGPGLLSIADHAETRIEGLSDVEYIRQSILEPGVFIVDGFAPIMPTTFAATLSDQNVNDLIAYLLSLNM